MQDLNSQNLHHAYLVTGDITESLNGVLEFLDKNFNFKNTHPDLFIFNLEDFGVENTQDLISANIKRPALGGKKFIISSFNKISHQAQNSLLKTLEEPEQNTHIFLITENASVFLPTVLSRVQTIKGGSNNIEGGASKRITSNKDNVIPEVKIFISSEIPKRLEMIKKILEEKEDEKIGDSEIFNFINSLEKEINTIVRNSSNSTNSIKQLKPFLIVDEYMRDNSSSKKLLLEYLALRLPIYKK